MTPPEVPRSEGVPPTEVGPINTKCASLGGKLYFLSMLKRPAPNAAIASRPPATAMFLKNIK